MSIKVTYELRRHDSIRTHQWEIWVSWDGITESCCYSCTSHKEAMAVLGELRAEQEEG